MPNPSGLDMYNKMLTTPLVAAVHKVKGYMYYERTV